MDEKDYQDLMQHAMALQKQKLDADLRSYTAQQNLRGKPQRELETALQDIAKIIEGMYEWGIHAKDPLGNLMPEEYGIEAKKVYRKLRDAIDNMCSSMQYQGKGYSGMWRNMITGRNDNGK